MTVPSFLHAKNNRIFWVVQMSWRKDFDIAVEQAEELVTRRNGGNPTTHHYPLDFKLETPVYDAEYETGTLSYFFRFCPRVFCILKIVLLFYYILVPQLLVHCAGYRGLFA